MESQSTTKKCCDRACATLPLDQHARMQVIGINYKTSILADREPLQPQREELAAINDFFISQPGALEALSLGTCNRIEHYLITRGSVSAFDLVAEMYRTLRNVDITPLREKFYERTEEHAIRHLFRVSAGLNSMVLGETQIFGQIKDAYSVACSVKSAGKILHRLFHQAFRCGKRVREDTTISQGVVSVGGVAAQLIRDRIPAESNPRTLFVGVNEMISLTAQHLAKAGYRHFTFLNRTSEHAEQLARQYDGASGSLDLLHESLSKADIVVACTAAEEHLITPEMIPARDNDRKIRVIDLGMPRDIDPAVRELPQVTLWGLDDINSEMDEGLKQRETAIRPAEKIVEHKLAQFMYWYDAVRLEPMFNGLGEAFDKIRDEEFTRALEESPEDHHENLKRLATRLTRRLLQRVARRSE